MKSHHYIGIGIGIAVGLAAGFAVSKVMPSTLAGMVKMHKQGTIVVLGVIGGYVGYRIANK